MNEISAARLSDVELVKKEMYHYLCIQLITTS
jgi:hypothetical protein